MLGIQAICIRGKSDLIWFIEKHTCTFMCVVIGSVTLYCLCQILLNNEESRLIEGRIGKMCVCRQVFVFSDNTEHPLLDLFGRVLDSHSNNVVL